MNTKLTIEFFFPFRIYCNVVTCSLNELKFLFNRYVSPMLKINGGFELFVFYE